MTSANPPPEAPAPEPQTQAPGVPPAAPPGISGNKFSAANDLMFEDCLKSILLKTKTGHSYCPYKTKFCPKAKQSPFGDFPPEYLPKKRPESTTTEESKVSSEASATMRSKRSWVPLTSVRNPQERSRDWRQDRQLAPEEEDPPAFCAKGWRTQPKADPSVGVSQVLRSRRPANRSEPFGKRLHHLLEGQDC